MIIDANLEIGPRNFPVVSGFRTMFCADPNCGPHFLLLDRDNQVFLEMIMTAEQISKTEQMTMEHIAGILKKSV